MFDTVTMSHCFSIVVGSALPLERSFWFHEVYNYSKSLTVYLHLTLTRRIRVNFDLGG